MQSGWEPVAMDWIVVPPAQGTEPTRMGSAPVSAPAAERERATFSAGMLGGGKGGGCVAGGLEFGGLENCVSWAGSAVLTQALAKDTPPD